VLHTFDINVNYPYITGAVIMLIGFVLGLVRIEEASEKDFEKVS
jgi:xanthine/uracil permease